MSTTNAIASSKTKRVTNFAPNLIVVKTNEKQESELKNDLPYIHCHLFATALSSAVTQLRILSEGNNNLRIRKTMADMGHLLTLKFHVEHKVEDPIDKIKPEELESDQYKLDKLFADRKYLVDVLDKTCIDMINNRCFNSLKTANMKLVGIGVYQDKLVEEEARNKIARRELYRQLRQQRNYFKATLYDTNLVVEHLKCQVEDTEINSQIRCRYIENWQLARTEQHDQKILDTESGPSHNVNYYQSKTDQEQRVHSEVELLVNISINETLMKVDRWMNKFEKDMEAQDVKIAKIKNKFKDATENRIVLEETYATHETLIKNWIQFKDERQKALDYWNNMTNSAIIVQAWWRGLLVRLKMGPYKPTRKLKKPPDTKDKK